MIGKYADGDSISGKKNANAEDEDIDITPMIDVTFLMLIFFLVTSTPDQQTAIELPPALHGEAVSQLESVIFTIAEGGLDNAPVYEADGKVPEFALSDDLDTQAEQIREAVEKGFLENKTDVVIKADRGVTYRNVARVISSVSQVEGIKLHLAVLDSE